MDNVSIPTGEIAKVEGTPMDFRTPHAVGSRINDKFEQLEFGAGYDHAMYSINANKEPLALLLNVLNLKATQHGGLHY